MLTPIYKNRFHKDLKRVKKRGKSTEKLKTVMLQLVQGRALPLRYHDHALAGNYNDCRECHVEPDWLLIYSIKDNAITFIRTGSHADLFK